MRLTVDLDDDVEEFVSAYAEGRGITFASALCELVRRAERVGESASDSPRLKRSSRGFLVIAGTGNVLTTEMVNEGSEDELL